MTENIMLNRIPSRCRSLIVFLLVIVVLAGMWLVEQYVGGVLTTATDPFPEWLRKWNLAGFIILNERLGSVFLDPVMSVITHAGSTIFCMFASVCLWMAKRRREAVLLAFGVVAGSLIILPLKMMFPTPRPYLIVSGARVLDTEGGGSFPSGHSKNAFTAAVVLGSKWKRLRLPFYIFACLIAVSRVYVGVHWPLDVVVGSIVGWIVGKLTVRYDAKIMTTLSEVAQSRILHRHVGS